MDASAPLLSNAESGESFATALAESWTTPVQGLHYCRLVLADAKGFALQNAIFEKVAGGLNYLGLTWATVVILSGHASGLDTYDFYVVTVILLASATRALLVQLSSQVIRLWQSGAVDTRWGHVLPLSGNYHGARRVMSSIKSVVMLAASAAAVARTVAMWQGAPYASGEPYSSSTLQGALVIFYLSVLLETIAMVVALVHRSWNKEVRVKRMVRQGPQNGHMAVQAFLWRRFARYILDECMNGSLYNGFQMQPVAFLVNYMVFTRRLRVVSQSLSQASSMQSISRNDSLAGLRRPSGAKMQTLTEAPESDFLAFGIINALDNMMPVVDPVDDRMRWRLEGFHAQGLAMQLVKLFLQEGSLLERGTIRWLLEHEPEVSYWYKVFAAASSETLLV